MQEIKNPRYRQKDGGGTGKIKNNSRGNNAPVSPSSQAGHGFSDDFPLAGNAASYPPAVRCNDCHYYAEIPTAKGRMRRLCRLTGEGRPTFGMAGCVPQRAASGLVEGLQSDGMNARLDFPNLTRSSNSLSVIPNSRQIIANKITANPFAGKHGKILDIGGITQRPHVRETAAASLRPGSVGYPAFCF